MGADKKDLKTHHEVSLHNSPNDCWVIINAKVYDVTNFLNDHPGGDEILLAAAGKDASEEFEEAGHGSAARLMLDEFYVAEINPSTKNPFLQPPFHQQIFFKSSIKLIIIKASHPGKM
ncbi:hypothetical protein RND71_004853 [Anisodus tanguticus]|uniref:Cytochrome b5 heme-binding domain-containing protein n=1 Tax=Anisodus tanguticus TaxID=243964 RepID=A0AAE1SR00_9SOLA|nr:hypothetical protein RND71_004853 [Anisodus tanguticus]